MSQYQVQHGYHSCIRILNFTKEPIPLEVLAALEELDESLKEYMQPEFNELSCCGSDMNRMDKEIEWDIGSPFEGGTTPIWQVKEQRWVYRNSWDGHDRLVPNGRDEVVANSVCIAIGG